MDSWEDDVVSDWEEEDYDTPLETSQNNINENENNIEEEKEETEEIETFDNILNEKIDILELPFNHESKKFIDKWQDYKYEKKEMKLRPVVPSKESKLFIQSKKKKKSPKKKNLW